MGGILSFLGGGVFRMIWGEVSHYLTAKQEQKQELERMKLQEEIDQAAHARNMESLKVQAELGIKEIEAKSDADNKLEELKAWAVAVTDVGKQTGIKWIDAWNAVIRPGTATWGLIAITLNETGLWALSLMATEIACAAIGIYLADRTLAKRGK